MGKGKSSSSLPIPLLSEQIDSVEGLTDLGEGKCEKGILFDLVGFS